MNRLLKCCCEQGTQKGDGEGHASLIMNQLKLEKCRAESSELGLEARKKQVRGDGSCCVMCVCGRGAGGGAP